MAELPQHTQLSLIEKDDRKDSDGDIITIVKATMRQLVGDNKPYKDYMMKKYRNQKNICTQRGKRQNKITTTIEEVVDDLDVDLLMDDNQSSTQPSTSSSS
ncbi:hypothetical protein DERF_012437 [Dermatophagoides farinae]|uniref:Uncharacterized protein n=1 Tax=Dermatophagoides farinae TaxID=6954 RepID=A0A922L064_DERFA|nr:hypothetical protein DERF_012437 [Dermatophagoides farinae]